jgi:DNA-directed RNA polymerase specialized sigma24 family protein
MIDESFFSDELIENTYLYCYKLLHNSDDAEDLTQDILLEALAAIRNGKEF